MDRPDPADHSAALHRALPVLLVPLVIVGGLVASRGDAAGRFWGLGVSLAVLAVGTAVVAVGVRDLVRARRRDAANGPQRRRRTATTLPSTVASSPGIGS